MKRARDVREQLLGLMDRVEVELVSNPGDHDAVCRSLQSHHKSLGDEQAVPLAEL